MVYYGIKCQIVGENVCDKMILSRMMFLFHTILLFTTDTSFKQWQKIYLRLYGEGEKTGVKYKMLKDAKEREVGIFDLKLYFAAC